MAHRRIVWRRDVDRIIVPARVTCLSLLCRSTLGRDEVECVHTGGVCVHVQLHHSTTRAYICPPPPCIFAVCMSMCTAHAAARMCVDVDVECTREEMRAVHSTVPPRSPVARRLSRARSVSRPCARTIECGVVVLGARTRVSRCSDTPQHDLRRKATVAAGEGRRRMNQ
jgi:hypothetical protein